MLASQLLSKLKEIYESDPYDFLCLALIRNPLYRPYVAHLHTIITLFCPVALTLAIQDHSIGSIYSLENGKYTLSKDARASLLSFYEEYICTYGDYEIAPKQEIALAST